MKDDENENFIRQIKTKYDNNVYFLGVIRLSETFCLTENYVEFEKTTKSFKIEDRIKEILKDIGLYDENDCCKKNNFWKKYLFIYDDEQAKEKSNEEEKEEDDEDEEEEDDEDAEEEDEEEKDDEDEEEEDDELNNKIKEKIKVLKEEYRMILKKLKSIYTKYLNICVKANEDYFFYHKVLMKLTYKYDEYFFYVNHISTIYIRSFIFCSF